MDIDPPSDPLIYPESPAIGEHMEEKDELESPLKSPVKSVSNSPKRLQSPKKSPVRSPVRQASHLRSSSLSPQKESAFTSPVQGNLKVDSPSRTFDDPFQYFEFPQQVSPQKKVVEEKVIPEPKLDSHVALYEQQAHQFENQLVKLTMELKSLKEQLQVKEAQAVKQGTENLALKAEIVKRDQKLKEQQEQHLQKAGKNQAFDQEKQNMGNMLVSKQQEISRLSEELSFAASQILDLKEQYRVEKERVVEYESIELHNKSLMNSAQQELLQANKSIEWLNEELTRKSQQLASYRREKGDQLTLVQTQLENVLQEKSSLEVRNQLVQKRADDLEQKLSQKMEQLREFENEKILTEQQFKSEMMSQKKLADLYQKKSQELSHHNQELENLMRELENRVLKVSEEHERVISEYTDTINGLKEHTTSQEMEIEKLKAQLGTMNADLAHKATSDQIGQLSETAAAASRLQKAGKSITQVYGEYAKIQQELIKEKAEVARLQECLNHIVNEFEQRAPLIQKTNEEYQKAREQIEHLGIQLATAVREKNETVLHYKKLKATVEAMETEQDLLQKELDDRSRQIQALLREQYVLKGGHPSTAPPAPTSPAQTGADAIISHRLVVFRNIEELQSQNQALLRSIRSLSVKMEQHERKKQDEDEIVRLETLNESTRMIEQLQEQLKREMLNCESFARERDQWRRIAETRGFNSPSTRPSPQRTPEPFMQPGSVPVSPAKSTHDYEQFYRDLQREYDQYRKECGTDTKLLKNQLDQKHQEYTEMSIQVAKLNNQINYLNERNELVQQNIETKNREFEQLRERMSMFNSTSARQDAKIEELSNSLMTARQSLEQLTNENQQLKVEKEIWKTSEARNNKELRDLTRERNTANDRIRELQVHLDEQSRKNDSQLVKLQDKLDEMTRDLQLSRKQLADVMDDNRTLTSKRDAEMREFQIKVERLNVDYERAKGDLALAINKEENASAKVAELTAKISLLEKRSIHFDSNAQPSAGGNQSAEHSRILESDLAQTRIELESVKSELVLAKEQVDAYKAISQASEDRLSEMNSTYDIYKADMETQVDQLKAKIEHHEKERLDLQNRLAKVSAELTETQEKMDEQLAEFNSAKELYERQLSSVKETEESALLSVAGIKADLERQNQAVQEAQSNYEREVIAHSASLQQVSGLKEANLRLKEDRDKAIAAQRASVESIASNQATFDRIKEKLELEIKDLEKRVEDLNQQNQLLHSQFEQLSLSKGPAEAVTEGENSVADLGEVIKYLRREKEIVETKLEIALQEADRSRLQIEHLQKSLDESRIVLEEERKRNLDASGSERKHQELLEKIEQANLLRESNITLRNQFEQEQSKIAALESKLRELQLQSDPLKQKVSQLESEVEVRKAEAKSLMEDNARWKGRAQQILEKYERIDPVEHEALKNNVKTLALAKENALKELQTLQENLQAKHSEKEAQIKVLEAQITMLKQERDQSLAEKENEINLLKDIEKNEKYTELANELVVYKEKYSSMTVNANQKLEGAFAKLREARRQVKELTQEKLQMEEKMKDLEEKKQDVIGDSTVIAPVDRVPEIQSPAIGLAAQPTVQPSSVLIAPVITTAATSVVPPVVPPVTAPVTPLVPEQQTTTKPLNTEPIQPTVTKTPKKEAFAETPSKRDREPEPTPVKTATSPAAKRIRVEKPQEPVVDANDKVTPVPKETLAKPMEDTEMTKEPETIAQVPPVVSTPAALVPTPVPVVPTPSVPVAAKVTPTVVPEVKAPSTPVKTITKPVSSPEKTAPPVEKVEAPKVPIQRTVLTPTPALKPNPTNNTPQTTPATDPAEDAKQKRALLLKQKLLAEQAKKSEQTQPGQSNTQTKPKIVRQVSGSENEQKRTVRAFGRGRGAQIKVKNPQGGQGRGKPQNQQ